MDVLDLARLQFALTVLPFTPVLIGVQVWVWRTFGPETRNGDGRTARIPSFF